MEEEAIIAEFDAGGKRCKGLVNKINKHTVWVEYDGPVKRAIIKRHFRKHNVKLPVGKEQ